MFLACLCGFCSNIFSGKGEIQLQKKDVCLPSEASPSFNILFKTIKTTHWMGNIHSYLFINYLVVSPSICRIIEVQSWDS